MKKPPQARSHMVVDLDGRPLPMGAPDVKALVDRALDSPDSEIILVALRYRGDLLLQVMGEPSRETLADVTQALETLRKGYKHILDGH